MRNMKHLTLQLWKGITKCRINCNCYVGVNQLTNYFKCPNSNLRGSYFILQNIENEQQNVKVHF